jgi:YesN/AraC family two-component response regulator
LGSKINDTLDSFCRRTQTDITIFDIEGRFKNAIAPRHLIHESKLCQGIKEQHLRACWSFDRDQLSMEMKRRQDPFWKICHAGFAEWAAPLQHSGQMTAILCIGLFHLQTLDQQNIFKAEAIHRPLPHRALPLSPSQQIDMEHIGQLLISHLERWLQDHASSATHSRQEQIQQFIHRHHRQNSVCLKDLSLELHLSEARVTQVLRDMFEQSFPELIESARSKSAKQMLTNTSLSIKVIADEIGYKDPNYFMRRFKRREGMTPSAFREEQSQQSV